MKTVFFIVTVFSIFIAGNVYLYVRSWQALELLGRFRLWYGAGFWTVALLFVFMNVVKIPGGEWLNVLHVVGSGWVAVMLYASLMLLTLDIVRLAGWAFSVRPAWIYGNYPLSKLILFMTVTAVMAVIFTVGYRKARYPEVTRLEIPVAKRAGELKELRIVMVSDIHLGHTAGRTFLRRVVNRINELEADAVLLAGDTFDSDPDPVIRSDTGAELDRLQSRYGVYAVSGNHEYIGERFARGSARKAFDYLASHGVTVLTDSVALVDGSFYIAGRDDYSARRRKPLDSLLRQVSGALPVILLDHQPYRLHEAQQAGVDLQLSGHTHHGQMWPINLITRKIYEKDWGYLKKGDTHFYISCGVGTWGPVLRTAGHSEIVLIRMIFNGGEGEK
ncbi:MAG: metallophosphoesterase [Bacteroidales bacterium]|jgi:predicted MPP superfamily phosphohydrolase|nr:metallophosphoesterase [Bacteroidales bacterium]